jgi:Copine
MDFSLANLTFSEDQCLHSTKPYKRCDYRDVLRSLCESYSNIMNIPIYGYSAKASSNSVGISQIFPLSRDLRNPFIFNNPMNVTEQYTDCLKELELGTPINLCSVFAMIKRLALLSKEQVLKSEDGNRLEVFYVVYILSSGLIDDLAELLTSLDCQWDSLPVQIHVVNLSGPNLDTGDLDTLRF